MQQFVDISNDYVEESRKMLKDFIYKYFPQYYQQETSDFKENMFILEQGVVELKLQSEYGCDVDRIHTFAKQQRERFLTIKDQQQRYDMLLEQNNILIEQNNELTQQIVKLKEDILKLEIAKNSAEDNQYLNNLEIERLQKLSQIQKVQIEQLETGRIEARDFITAFLDYCSKLGIDTHQNLITCLRDLQNINQKQQGQMDKMAPKGMGKQQLYIPHQVQDIFTDQLKTQENDDFATWLNDKLMQ